MAELSDETLLQLWTENPARGFSAIYDRYSGPLFRYIYRFTANLNTAEEILHDVFLQFLNGKFRLDAQSNLKNWLYTLARNRSLNFCSKMKFEISTSSEHIDLHSSPADLEADTIEANLHSKLEFVEQKLPLDLFQTWTLRKQGLDHREIARTLGIPVGTVKSRFSRLTAFFKEEF